jgi:hypothetical protein
MCTPVASDHHKDYDYSDLYLILTDPEAAYLLFGQDCNTSVPLTTSVQQGKTTNSMNINNDSNTSITLGGTGPSIKHSMYVF